MATACASEGPGASPALKGLLSRKSLLWELVLFVLLLVLMCLCVYVFVCFVCFACFVGFVCLSHCCGNWVYTQICRSGVRGFGDLQIRSANQRNLQICKSKKSANQICPKSADLQIKERVGRFGGLDPSQILTSKGVNPRARGGPQNN